MRIWKQKINLQRESMLLKMLKISQFINPSKQKTISNHFRKKPSNLLTILKKNLMKIARSITQSIWSKIYALMNRHHKIRIMNNRILNKTRTNRMLPNKKIKILPSKRIL